MIWIVGILSFIAGGVIGVIVMAALTASALQDRVEEAVNDYIRSKGEDQNGK